MRRFADLSVRHKITVVSVFVSSVALLLASTAFVAYDWVSAGRTMLRRLSSEAEIVAINCATPLLFGDPKAAAQILAGLQAEPEIVAAALYDDGGRLFAIYQSPAAEGLPVADARLPPSGAGHAYEGNHLAVTRAVRFEERHLGTVWIRASLAGRTVRVQRYAWIVAGVSLAALLVAALVASRTQRTISGPLLRLAEAARTVSEGHDLSVRAESAGKDELGVLVGAFNRMLEAIQRRDEDLRRTHAELARQNRFKDEFLATLSHELRTPLNAIVGWTHLLRGGLDAAGTSRAIDTISRNAMTQSQLIADILDIQRIASGKLRLNLRSVDPVPVVEAALDTIRPAASAKDIALRAVLDPRAGPILGDPDRILQMVWNLLSNAVKFTPPAGTVQVSLARADGQVEISVRDNGPGIDPALIPHVFERFRQADSSSTRRHGGLGLGLAIVRDLAELHGGSVFAANRADGTGAVFTMRLPLATAALAQAAAHDSRHHSAAPTNGDEEPVPSLYGLKVLVVDDEVDSRELIAAILARCGADVTAASSAAEGLDRLREIHPDVLLSDIEMPGEDGYTLLSRIRALPADEGGLTPAAALTAYAGPADRVRALAAGFQMHVPKPIQPGELAAVAASLGGLTRPVAR